MEKLAMIFGVIMIFGAMILVIAPLGVALGWLAGWTVQIVFGDLVLNALAAFGVHGPTLPQIGAALGFFSAFLRTQTTVKAKD